MRYLSPVRDMRVRCAGVRRGEKKILGRVGSHRSLFSPLHPRILYALYVRDGIKVFYDGVLHKFARKKMAMGIYMPGSFGSFPR